jgi:hypothetical protein
MHVIIDTNIYRKVPRLDSPEFKSLSYMARIKCICLHVPYIVEKEFLTFLEQVQQEKIDKAINAITSAVNFENKGPKTSNLSTQLEKLVSDRDDLILERGKSFTNWLDQNLAIHHPLTLEQTNNALEAYFNGEAPLKSPKVRNDIPDSFIYQKIVELQKKYGDDLCVIVEDKKMLEACISRDITSFSSIVKFLESEKSQNCLKQKLLEENKSEVYKHVRALAISQIEKIKEEVELLLLSDEYREIYGDQMPGENDEVFVSGVHHPHFIEFDNTEYFGAGLFVIQFLGKVELQYIYPLSHSDAFDLDMKKYSIEPLNEHYVEVETVDEFQFFGRVELDFGEKILEHKSLSDLLGALEDPKIEISELEDFSLTPLETEE